MTTVTSGSVFITLLLCGLLGVLGQGVRAAIGLKGASRLNPAQVDQQTAFSAAYFFLSLMIGFVAGVLAGLAIGLKDLMNINPDNLKTLFGIAAAGYAGADFIENSLSIVIPAGGAASAAKPAIPAVPAGPQALDIDLKSHTLALTSAVQQLTSVTGQLVSAPALSPPTTVPSVPAFAAALRKVSQNQIDLAQWEAPLSLAFQKYELNTAKRIAAAIGQFMAEAGEGFEEVVENMNYTHAERIAGVWPKLFKTAAQAEPYVRQPQKLGNFVYANKLGNGDEGSGDGYRFRGRGLIQLTGRKEYGEFGAVIGMTAEKVSEYCETPAGAAMSGCWYLASRGCLPMADRWALDDITVAVNGTARRAAAERAQKANEMLAELSR